MKRHKIIKIGEQIGCVFGDIISIKLSPNEIEQIAILLKQKAIDEHNYDFQGIARNFADIFIDAYNEWRKKREIKNAQ